MERVQQLAAQHAVVIFSVSTCCMCHVVKNFFRSLGVNAIAYELDQEQGGKEMERALAVQLGRNPAPAVFIGGRLVGRTEVVMAHHLNGTLGHMLREAGALWLL